MTEEQQMCLACNERPATSGGPVPLCSTCEDLAKPKQRGVEFQKRVEPETKPSQA